MTAEALLSRLEGVKRRSRDSWYARCPAHDDRLPSLAIRELSDGRVLIHDFGGCCAADVLSAVGLTFDDLYPERPVDQHVGRERRPFNAVDVLALVAREALIVAIAAGREANGHPLNDADRARLLLAASRLQSAVELVNAR